MTATILGSCVFGLLTYHGMMGEVLQNKPDRVVPGIDVYLGVVRCEDIGRRYVLIIQGKRYDAVAADCVAWGTPTKWPTKRAPNGQEFAWLGDAAGVGVLAAPTPALLCPVPVDP